MGYENPSPWAHDERWLRPDEMWKAFAPFFSSLRAAGARTSSGVFPAVNLYDDGKAFLVRAELPGVKKESLEITARGDQLTLRGERTFEGVDSSASWHRRECAGGTFHRTVELPQAVDADRVQATYREGVLEVTLPRVPEMQPRRIALQ